MNTFCTFYIVRHGKSVHNGPKHIISGQLNPDLAEEGKKEAEKRAKDFKNIHFDAIFSSDLLRANRTAEIIAKEHSLAVNAVQILRERNYGQIQGQSGVAMEKKLKEKLNAYNLMNYDERLHFRAVPDMENDEEVIGRMSTFLRETALVYPGKTILVVAHGNIIRTFLVHLGLGTHQELSHETIANTGYVVIKSDGVDFEVVKTVGINKKVS